MTVALSAIKTDNNNREDNGTPNNNGQKPEVVISFNLTDMDESESDLDSSFDSIEEVERYSDNSTPTDEDGT